MNTTLVSHDTSRLQRPLKNRQQGVVLIISLIILMVMTLIGVTTMQSTTLQERMAGNTRQRNLAFQAGEAGLRAGETLLQGATLPAFGSDLDPGLLDPWVDPTSDPALTTSSDVATYWMAYDWTDTGSQNYGGTLDDTLSSQPRYVIEHLFDKPGAGSLDATRPGAPESWYRVTARGVGGTGNAVVILQSLYRR